MPTVEQWKYIENTDGRYSVSNHGRIRSEDATVILKNGRQRKLVGRIRSLGIDPQGRPMLAIRISGDDKQSLFRVSHLVAAAFIGPRPEGLHLCHLNGDNADNRPENLRWDTASANMRDAVRHGTHVNAAKTHCKRGHEFTPENTYNQAHGGRACRTCVRNASYAYHQRKRAERVASKAPTA